MRRRKNFGQKTLEREVKIIATIVGLFVFMGLAIFAGIRGMNFSFDLREQAAGKTYFVNDGKELEDTIAKASDSDAIFLKVGNYTTTSANGFLIKDKDIRILGAGEDFVEVSGNNNSYAFQVQNASVSFESFKIRGATKDGILVTNTGSKEVSFKDIEFTSISGSAINTNSKSIVTNSFINQNGTGISSSNGELTVRNTVIQNSASNGIVIKKGSTSTATIENVILSQNKDAAILLEGGNSHNIKNVTISNNGSGIKETVNTNLKVANAIVMNSEKEGIYLTNSGTSVKYTNSHNNSGGNFKPESIKDNEGNLTIASQTISNTDFHLATNSALRDKGFPNEKDRDGTRIDLGAYGGLASIDDANAAPTISSTPPSFVKAGQQYTYEVKATDPDGDKLEYVVLNSSIPAWLKQNGNVFTGTPTESDVGFVGISLVVTDKYGHNVVHPISINVLSSIRVIPTAVPTTRPTGTNPTPTQPPVQNPVPSISIVSPTSSTKFDKNSAEIKWSITNGNNVEKVVLSYSSDKEKFETITTLPADRTTHNWDISKLTNGNYLLKVEVYEKGSDKPIAKISEQFEIKKSTTPDPTKTPITITKISPEDSDLVDNRRQTIQVEFSPKVDIDKTKTYLKVNGKDVTYQTTQGTIYYTPTQDYSRGNVQIEAKIVSKEGSEDSRKWVFKIPTNTVSQDTTPDAQREDKINILGIKLPKPVGLIILAIIIFGLLILILYFIVRLIRTIRDERQGNLEAEFTEYYDQDDTAYAPQTTETQYTTTTNENYLNNDSENLAQTYTTQDKTVDYNSTNTADTTVYTQTDENIPNSESVLTTTNETAYNPEVETTVSNDDQYTPTETTYTSTPVTDYTTTEYTDSNNDIVYTPDNAVESNSQTATVQSDTTVIEDEDPYITELKKKYGDDNTQSFTVAEQTSTVESTNVSDNTNVVSNNVIEQQDNTTSSTDFGDQNDNTEPDPSQASVRPQKKN